MVNVLTDLAIDPALDDVTETNLLGILYSTEANMEPLHICKTIYLPANFVGISL